MQEELQNQRDWYWSCRGRSYFMEIIIALERMYGLIGYGVTHQKSDSTPIIKNAKLRDAVLYIESRFDESITLPDIAKAAGDKSHNAYGTDERRTGTYRNRVPYEIPHNSCQKAA